VLTPEIRHFRLGVHDDEPVLSVPPMTPGACQGHGTRTREQFTRRNALGTFLMKQAIDVEHG
jgi:hypothetical protein